MAASAAGAADTSTSTAGEAADSVSIPVVDRSSVEAIQARYRGQGLLTRLCYLARADTSLKARALEQAAHVARSLNANPKQYCDLREEAGLALDSAWVAEVTSEEETRVLNLERDLNMKLAAQDRAGIQVSPKHIATRLFPVQATHMCNARALESMVTVAWLYCHLVAWL